MVYSVRALSVLDLDAEVARNQAIKVTAIAFAICFSFSIIMTYSSGSLYPWHYVASFLFVLFLLLFLIFTKSKDILFVFAIFSVFYRGYIFLFPASLIGADPDDKVINIQRMLSSGSIDSIVSFRYNALPNYHLFSGQFQLISNISPANSLVLYPISIGIVFFIFPYIITRIITDNPSSNAPIYASALGSVAGMSVNLAYLPIAQSLSSILWIIILYSIFKMDKYGGEGLNIFVVFATSTLGLVYTHPLPLYLLGVLFISALLLNIRSKEHANHSILYLMLLSLLMVGLQSIYISGNINTVVNRALFLFTTDTITARPEQLQQLAVTDPMPGLEGIFFRNGHGLVLLPVAGVFWLVTYFYGESRNHRLLLILSATIVLFAFFGFVNRSAVPIGRIILLAEPLLAAIIGIGAAILSRGRLGNLVGFLIVLIVISSQIFSGVAIVDYPQQPRHYLNEGEVSAKEFFINSNFEDVSSDRVYAEETPPSLLSRRSGHGPRPKFGYSDKLLVNGTSPLEDYRYYAFRPKISVYYTKYGPKKLNWNISCHLDTEQKVFSNGHTELYFRSGRNNQSHCNN